MRISREQVLMESTRLWGRRSTCKRAKVGASITRDSRILMSGYNGAPAGLEHCNHDCSCASTEWEKSTVFTHFPRCPSVTPCTRSIHAEQNAINYAARLGVAIEGAHLYVTMMPCLGCAKSIISAGIVAVTYDLPYRDKSGINLLLEAEIEVHGYNDEQPTPTPGS